MMMANQASQGSFAPTLGIEFSQSKYDILCVKENILWIFWTI